MTSTHLGIKLTGTDVKQLTLVFILFSVDFGGVGNYNGLFTG